MQRRSEGSNAYNIRQDKELGQKAIVQKTTWHFSWLPRPFTQTGTSQIFHAFGRKIWGRPFGQIMPTALFGLTEKIIGAEIKVRCELRPGFKNKIGSQENNIRIIILDSCPPYKKIASRQLLGIFQWLGKFYLCPQGYTFLTIKNIIYFKKFDEFYEL